MGKVIGLEIPEDALDTQSEVSLLLRNTHKKLCQLGKLRAEMELADIAGAPRLETVIQFFANARPEPRDLNSYRFHGVLGNLARPLVLVAAEMSESEFSRIVHL